MDFNLTDEQEMLRDSVRAFLEKEMEPLDREHGDRAMTGDLARDLLKRLIPFGYVGPEQPSDPIMRAILDEELGRVFPSLAGMQFVTGIAAMAVAYGAHPDVSARLGRPMIDCDLIGCMAFSEPNVGSDPTAVECKATRAGDSYVVNGTKTWISNGHIADVAVIMLRLIEPGEPESLGFLVVDRQETPFESRDIATLGLRAFPLSELFFDDLEVPAVNLMRTRASLAEGSGERRRRAPDFDIARVPCASISCGIAQKALEMALDYVKERRQFGKEIGRHQLVQELIADMAMDLEAARLLTYKARQSLGAPGSSAAVSMAKAYATEMGVRVTSKAMECMGAMGLTQEAHVERLYRDARMWIVPDGTAQIQRLVIGRELTGFSALRD